MNAAHQYIQAVKQNQIQTGELVKLAISRHETDLKKSKSADFPYYFNESAAEHPIKFFSSLRFVLGQKSGEKFELQPWQAFILWVVYGWKRKKNDKRRFRTAYIKVARKNGKTEFLAGIGNYGFLADKEKDPHIYWTATKKDQARIGFDRQRAQMLKLKKDSGRVDGRVDVSKYSIFEKSGMGFVQYLGRDSDTEDGLSPYYGLIDEYHAHPNDGMRNVIESGMGSRSNPIVWIITTAGFNSQGPCAQFEKVCGQILRGQVQNDEIFALIYDIDEGDDWNDERIWSKANPNLGVSLPMDFLRTQYKNALTRGSTARVNFLTKNLNVWTTVADTWISDEDWMKGAKPINFDELRGRQCYGGLDLAATRDLCSFCLVFPPENANEPLISLWWYWLPAEEAERRETNDGIPYSQWAEEGWINLTPGNVRDAGAIVSGIRDAAELYDIRGIAYDRWGATEIILTLQDDGANMEPFGQGYRSMSAPTRKLEELAASGAIIHAGNPVSRWQCSNIAIERDAADNMKINKRKSAEKVDGMVALAMALGVWMDYMAKEEKTESAYNDGEELIIF